MPEDARKAANLRLLQRSIAPDIHDIVGSATHVVLYEYQHPQGWEKSQVEGSLFLVAQGVPGGPPASQQYSLIILNRNSTENFFTSVTKAFQLQHKEPYLIFKQAPKILGIWFHNANERVVMASLLKQVIENLQNSAVATAQQPPLPPSQPPTQQPNSRMSPMAQHVPVGSGATPVRGNMAHAESPSQLIEPLMNSLFVSPQASNTGTTTTPSTDSRPAPPMSPGVALDKKSLQLALLSLIQDDRFIDLLHAQYLKVAHARVNRNNKK